MATFNAVSPRVVSLVPSRLPARTVHARPAERGRGPALATVRPGYRATPVVVLRVETVDCACLENGSYRRNSLRVVDVCSRAEHVGDLTLRPSRNCQTVGGATGAVKPAARQGRSEAEWLDRAEDRRTIRRCDVRSVWPPGSERENP